MLTLHVCGIFDLLLDNSEIIMSEETMPAIEAAERNNYELAFHILPTVAEGGVSKVFDTIKSLITTNTGEITNEESPARFELAYEIIKRIDGKNRKFSSAYFGWVRFRSEAEVINLISKGMDDNDSLLRHMLLKLTKTEEVNEFRFHEALAKSETKDVEIYPKKSIKKDNIKSESESESESDADTVTVLKKEASEVVSEEALESPVTSEEEMLKS